MYVHMHVFQGLRIEGKFMRSIMSYHLPGSHLCIVDVVSIWIYVENV